MNASEILVVKNNLFLLGRVRDELFFAYTASGYDEKPFLLTAVKSIPVSDLMKLMKTNSDGIVLQGKISKLDIEQYCFTLDADTPEMFFGSFVNVLRNGLADQFSLLKTSIAEIGDSAS